MARRPVDPIVIYDALSVRISRQGEVAIFHVRMDPTTRRLTTELLASWLLEESGVPTAAELFDQAVRAYKCRRGVQLELW